MNLKMETKGESEPLMHGEDTINVTSRNAEFIQPVVISDFISTLLEAGMI